MTATEALLWRENIDLPSYSCYAQSTLKRLFLYSGCTENIHKQKCY